MNSIAKAVVSAGPGPGRNTIAYRTRIAPQLWQNKDSDMKIEVGGRKHAGRGGSRFGGIGKLRWGVHFIGDDDDVVIGGGSVARWRGEVELGGVKIRRPLGADPASVHCGSERVTVVGVQVCAPETAVGADAQAFFRQEVETWNADCEGAI